MQLLTVPLKIYVRTAGKCYILTCKFKPLKG